MSEKIGVENVVNQVNIVVKDYVNLMDKNNTNLVLKLIDEIVDLIEVYGVYYVPENTNKTLIELIFELNSKLPIDKKCVLVSEYFELDSFKDTIDEELFDYADKVSASVPKIDSLDYDIDFKNESFKEIIFSFLNSKSVFLNIYDNNLVSLNGNKLIHFYDRNSNKKNEVYSLINNTLQPKNAINLFELNIDFNSLKNKTKINVKNLYHLITESIACGLFQEENSVRFISFIVNGSIFKIELNDLISTLRAMLLLGWSTTILSTSKTIAPENIIFTDFKKNRDIYNENFLLIKTIKTKENIMILNLNNNNFEYLIK